MQSNSENIAHEQNDLPFNVSSPAFILIDNATIQADTLNISTSGAMLCVSGCTRDLLVDELFPFQVTLHSKTKPIQAIGRVTSVHPRGNGKVILQLFFDSIDGAAKARLHIFLRLCSLNSEKRKDIRFNFRLEARIRIMGQLLNAHSQDISVSGIRLCFESPQRFTVGEEHEVEIDLPGMRKSIKTLCKVMRIDQQDFKTDRRMIAFQYTKILNIDQYEIREFIEQHERERSCSPAS